jgi:hypothetical protein
VKEVLIDKMTLEQKYRGKKGQMKQTMEEEGPW